MKNSTIKTIVAGVIGVAGIGVAIYSKVNDKKYASLPIDVDAIEVEEVEESIETPEENVEE